jgi:two-component system sensor histidine kinase/response regulator
VLAKILINAWESYDNKPVRSSPALDSHAPAADPRGRRISRNQGHRPRLGIDPEIRDKMFEPFVSTKNTVGVGMGLTVARHALRNLGGEVTMLDTPGGGTTAVLMHPAYRKPRTVGPIS